jgi:two-component system, NarL family, sensor kinase
LIGSRGADVKTAELKGQHHHSHPAGLEDIQEVIDLLDEQVAVVGCGGTIIAVNNRWRRQVERQARHGLLISRDYISFLTGLIESGDRGAVGILQAFKDIAAGSSSSFHCVYNGTGAFAGYDFNIGIAPMQIHDTRHVLVSVHDVTELVALKRQRRRVRSQLLQAQEGERRRMARELHDSTSQNLIALQINLSQLSRLEYDGETASIVKECRQVVQEMQREIRAFSFIAHPPTLIPNNLALALEKLVNGFAARTGIEIDLSISNVGEVSASVETAIYRVSQEALTNIHRHASATRAIFRLIPRERYLHLLIRDDGIGTPVSPGVPGEAGVGVVGMEERIRELGGRLSVRHAVAGTTLTAVIPRQKKMVFAPLIGAR